MKGFIWTVLLIHLQLFQRTSCWCYAPSREDCSHWTGLCSAGRRQSPINITDIDNRTFAKPVEIRTNYMYHVPISNFTVYNNGHAGNIKLNIEEGSPLPQLQVEFRQGVYFLHNIHFHWGSTVNQGSEHALRGVRFPMEMHWVHYNDKYANVLEAGASDDPYSILVLAVFIKAPENIQKPPCCFEHVIDNLKFVRKQNTEHVVPNGKLKLSHMLPTSFLSPKFVVNTYEGSLTTPPCSETVEWVIADEPIYLTEEQMSEFHKLELELPNSSASPGLNDRDITTYHPVVYKRQLRQVVLKEFNRASGSGAAVNVVEFWGIFIALCLSTATLLRNDLQ